MKKELAMAFGLVAVSATALVIAVALQSSGGAASAPVPVHDLLPPARITVLAGAADGLEVLVKRRLPAPEARRSSDAMLARALGLDPGAAAFLEVLVLNVGDRPRRVSLAALELQTEQGTSLEVGSLHASVREAPGREALLAAHAPDPAVPLAAGSLRRGLVVVPTGLSLRIVSGARLAGVELATRRVSTAGLEAWLERPRRPLLLAVLSDEDAGSQGSVKREGGR